MQPYQKWGGMDLVYSTDERIIGSVVINGVEKKLYQRDFYVSSISTNKTATVLDRGTSTTEIFDYNLRFTRGAGKYAGMKCFYGSASDYFSTICALQGSPLNLIIYIDTSWALNTMSDYYVTVQYTKS